MPTAHQPGPSRPDTLMSRVAPDASRPRALFADDRSRYAGSKKNPYRCIFVSFLVGILLCHD